MTIEEVFADKLMKAKGRVILIGEWLLEESFSIDELMAFAEKQTAATKASCIEAIEFATKKNPSLADKEVLDFMMLALMDDEPRIKWESAKVIANIAKSFPENLQDAIRELLKNSTSDGTVVRWATALALGEILKLKTDNNKSLLPKLEKLAELEADNGVKNKYLDAIRRAGK